MDTLQGVEAYEECEEMFRVYLGLSSECRYNSMPHEQRATQHEVRAHDRMPSLQGVVRMGNGAGDLLGVFRGNRVTTRLDGGANSQEHGRNVHGVHSVCEVSELPETVERRNYEVPGLL